MKPHQAPASPTEVRPTTHLRQFQRRLSAQERDALVVDYQAGVAVNDLAERYRVSRMTVMRQVERAGVPRRWRILQPADVEEACRLYAAGLSMAKIAVKFDVHPSTIRRALVQAGVRLRDPHGRER